MHVSDTKAEESNVQPAGAKAPMMPPYLVLRDLLNADTVSGLFDFSLAHEGVFEPTGVGRTEQVVVKPDVRVSVGTHDLGPFRTILRDKLRALLTDLTVRLRTPPVDDPTFELQLVAHNDGAFYKRHIDTQTASDRQRIRVLSGVYYFHAEPKAFTGGALRLHAIGDPDMQTFVDIEPDHNTLLVFPSWAPHEVMPVSCPSRRFADSRFAINCWVRRPKGETAPGEGSLPDPRI